MEARSAVRDGLKSALWASGALAGYHRLRNRNTLTVAAFHRVLDPHDPRWDGADPLWTVSQTFFAQCLDFFERNYRVVSLADVLAAREGGRALPRWPLLITFDDGWADNRDYALPELRQRGLPAALFIVTGVIGQREGFWQERVLAAFKTARVAPSVATQLWRRLWPDQTEPERYALPAVRRIVAAVAELPVSERKEILQCLPPISPADPADMLDDLGLRDLAHSGVAIGTHGVSHEPLTAVDDPAAELRHSWQDLQQKLGEATGAPTLSFPHGQYGWRELELARRLGYRLMFTSNRGLNRIDGNRISDVLGRIEITTQLCAADGQLRPEKLALWLFLQPHLHLPHPDRPHLDPGSAPPGSAMMSPWLHARVLKPEALSAGEVAAWDDLCQDVSQLHSAFYSHAFALAASRAGYRVRVAILEDLNGIVGFFPFQFRHRLAESLGMAERVGEEMSDYFGMVTKPTVRVTPSQLLAACRLSCCCFTHLDEWQAGIGLRAEQPEPSPRIELPPNIKDYWEDIKRRDKKLVADTNRCSRKIEKDVGELNFQFQSVERMSDFDILLSLKRKQYLATTNNDLLSERHREQLLRNLLHASSRDCKGVMSVLRADREVVALHFGLQCHEVLHYWFPVYNPALKAYAPGRLLLSALIAASHEQGIHIIDLGAGDSEAKRKLANSKLTVYRGMWSRNATTRLVGRTLTFFQWRLGVPFM